MNKNLILLVSGFLLILIGIFSIVLNNNYFGFLDIVIGCVIYYFADKNVSI